MIGKMNSTEFMKTLERASIVRKMLDKIIDFLGRLGLLLFLLVLTGFSCYGLFWLAMQAFEWLAGISK